MIINKRADNYGVPLAHMLLATSLGKQHSALSYLQQTKIPIHYCVGGKDKKYQKISAQLRHLKNINTVVFEQAGHNTHQHNAQQFTQFILQHLIPNKRQKS